MRKNALLIALAIAATSSWPGPRAQASERISRAESVEAVVHYDLYLVEGDQVSDASGKNHDGTLLNGEIVYGRSKNAVKLDGQGAIVMAIVPDAINPESQPLTVGALCRPVVADAVAASLGDQQNGFSLHLKDGVPHFAVRSNGKLSQVVADEPVVMNQWVHLAGVIDARGNLRLMVNGWPSGETPGKLIGGRPTEPFCVGADLGSPVGDYTTPMHWTGLLQDIRLYWGVLDRIQHRQQWKEWGDAPGCCGGM